MHGDPEENKERGQSESSGTGRDGTTDEGNGRKRKEGHKRQNVGLRFWHSWRWSGCVLSSYSTVWEDSLSHWGLQRFLTLPPTSSQALCLLTPCCHLSSSPCDSLQSFCLCWSLQLFPPIHNLSTSVKNVLL